MIKDKSNTILLLMPPFWDPICMPLGIVCLKTYLEERDYKVQIFDFNTYGELYNLQKQYFETCINIFSHWKYYNIFRNAPRYFARHQLAFLNNQGHDTKYKELIRLILNIDGKSFMTDEMIGTLDVIIKRQFEILDRMTDELISRYNPDVVGCTMMESTFPSSLSIFQKVKKRNSKIVTVLGGPGVLVGNTIDDGNFKEIMNRCPSVDTILFGEAERLFVHYLENCFGEKIILSTSDLEAPGNRLLKKSQEDRMLNVNDIPLPNYDGLLVKKYLWLSIFTSRGCPFKCSFCFEKDYWEKFRKKSVSSIIEEMKELTRLYGKNKFYICDSLINHIATPLAEALVLRGEKFRIDCYLRITQDCLDDEKVNTWAQAGIERVRLGIESAAPHVLKLMNKNISICHMKKSLENFAKYGIFTSTLWIAGFPGERDEDFEQSLEFIRENHNVIYQADVWEFITLPDELNSGNSADSNYFTKKIYPEEFDDLLLLNYYDVKSGCGSPERFERISRFEKNRIALNIPNPYSIGELIEAQKRWERLGHLQDNRSYV